MRRPELQKTAPRAKPRLEIRPYYGMPLGKPATGTPTSGALTCLGVLWAISGCFNVNHGSCRISCVTNDDCPSSLICVMEEGSTRSFCATAGTTTCPPFDAGANADAIDRADAADAMDGGDGASDTGSPLPPEVLCHNGTCFPLPPEVRANIVLLLWPSNLPAVGSPVSIWQDQSGQGNNANALRPDDALPHVIADGVQLDPNKPGSGFKVFNSPTLDFGGGDFAVIVVAGLSGSTAPVSFFRQSDGARVNSRQIAIDWVLSSALTGRPQGAVDDTLIATDTDLNQPSVGAYTLRRTTKHLELRLNGTVLGSADLPAPDVSTSNAADVFLGVAGVVGSPADSIEAVVALRGPVGTSALNELEAFLRTLFATGP
jgi:hypothetical protein